MITPELLPCPFCGHNAEIISTEALSTVECTLCGAKFEDEGSVVCAVARWNFRNHAPALLDEIERLKSKINGMAIRYAVRVAELETEVESSRKVGNTRIRQIKVSPAKIRAAMERATQNSKTWVVWKDQKWKANDKVEDNYDHDNLAQPRQRSAINEDAVQGRF